MKKNPRLRPGSLLRRRKIVLIMKLSTIFLLLALHVSATNYAQRILNLSVKDVAIADVLRMLEK